jgi:hypothetical protein
LSRSHRRPEPRSPPHERGATLHSLPELGILPIGAHRDATALVEQRGVRAARLRAVKADIAANLNDFELSVSAVAVRHGVTPVASTSFLKTTARRFLNMCWDSVSPRRTGR